MTKIGIEDLKKSSKLWIEKKEQIFKTNMWLNGKQISKQKVYYISSDIIIDNLFYSWFKFFEAKSEKKYRKIEKDILKNGWDDRYPGTIKFTMDGGVYFHNGSHRINMCVRIKEPIIVPVIFGYQYKPIKYWRELEENSKSTFPHGFLPKWDWGKK